MIHIIKNVIFMYLLVCSFFVLLDWLKTPDTPYGAFLHGPNPSRSVRKRWKQWCENLPKPDSPLPPKTPSPVSIMIS